MLRSQEPTLATNKTSLFRVNKHVIITIVLIIMAAALCCSRANGQNQYEIPIPKVIPPSPDAASLGKYGSTPVGLHTGIPNISIPLYTVKSGSLELPISISYHAAGVKVNEIASWVGLGWSLNAGGVVTRSVVGKSDEGGFWNMTVKNATLLTSNDYNYAKAIADGNDGESDFYFFNFNERSGKFIYKQNDNVTPYQIPQSPLSIKFIPSRFEILDEAGNKYIFGQPETTQTLDGSAETYNSAYYLTQIIAANGVDNIQLTYVVDGGYFEGAVTDTETIGGRAFDSGGGSGVSNEHLISSSTSSRFILPVRLSEITFATGKVSFIKANDRSDLPSNSRLTEIQIKSKNSDGSYSAPIKTFTFTTGYFGTTTSDYRLKLTEVIDKDALSTTVRKHTFFYNETIALPARISRAQDWWGFYNGQNTNTSLIQTETLTVAGYQYNVGGGSRQPSATHMGAGLLSRITYPTGGYTDFTYEPHYYAGGVVLTPQTRSASAGAMGNTTDLLQQTVSFTVSTTGWAKVSTYCSDVTDAEPFFSTVTLTQQSNGLSVLNHVYSPYVFNPYPSHLTKDYMVYLLAGNTYDLKVMSKGNSTSTQFNGAAFSQATINWNEESTGTSVMAGGLRVKTIKDYASASATPITKEYRYGVGGSGTGILLIPNYGLSSAKRDIDWIFNSTWNNGGAQSGCTYAKHSGTRKVISGTAPLDLTSLNGAPVVYPEVTVYENTTSAPNGRQVSKFDVEVDEFTSADKAYNNGFMQLNNSWRGGDEVWNSVYTSGSVQVTEKFSNSSILNSQQTNGTKVGYKIQMEGCMPTPGIAISVLFSHLYYFDYPTYSGVKKPYNTKEIKISQSDPLKRIEQTEEYFFEKLQSNHQQLTKKITTDSDGDQITTKYWYPADYDTSTFISGTTKIKTLLNANIIGKPIKTEKTRGTSITEGDVQTYNQYGDPVEIYRLESGTNPTHANTVIVPAGYVKKADITYDATSRRVNKVQLTSNISTGYIWNYSNSYPVAKVENAAPTDVAATSFEFDSKGNWNYTGATFSDIAVKTGSKYYKLNGTNNITKSITAGTYKLEYWARSAVTLSGGTRTLIRSTADANGWTLYEYNVTTASTVTLTLSGTASIDELRLYPINAQITTYTYDVINGITSVNDPNNFVTYYDYDLFGRLKWIKDYKGNIVKAMDYHYKGN